MANDSSIWAPRSRRESAAARMRTDAPFVPDRAHGVADASRQPACARAPGPPWGVGRWRGFWSRLATTTRQAVGATAPAVWVVLRHHPLAWLLPALMGGWGWLLEVDAWAPADGRSQWAAGMSLLTGLWAAAVEHERGRRLAATDGPDRPGGRRTAATCGVAFVVCWTMALHVYGPAAPLLCWLGAAGCVALRAGGPAGWALGAVVSTWAASVSWAGQGDLLGMFPDFGLGTLSPAHAHDLHAQWVSALGHSRAWGPSHLGAAALSGLNEEQLGMARMWPLHLMLSVGRWPTAVLLAFIVAVMAGLTGYLAVGPKQEPGARRVLRRTAAVLWGQLLAVALLFACWVYGWTWRPAVPGLVPLTGQASAWALAGAAMVCAVLALRPEGGDGDWSAWARPAQRRGYLWAAVAAVALALAAAHGEGMAHAQRLERLAVLPPEPADAVPSAPMHELRPVTDARAIELGEAVLHLMPDPGQDVLPWKHRANGPVDWMDAPLRSWRSGIAGLLDHRRAGLLRVHVQGATSQVLGQRMEEVWWLVLLESEGDQAGGVQTITLRPGGGQGVGAVEGMCFGLLFDGCQFEVLPSLRAAGISAELVCESREQGEVSQLYELRHPQRRTTQLSVLDGYNDKGRFTVLTLLVRDDARPPCLPR